MITLIINHYKAIFPSFFVFFFQSKVEEGLLRQMLYLHGQWMDFKNLNGVLEAEKILHNLCTGCPKKIARIRRTQNSFSGNTFLMCRVLVHIYGLSLIVEDLHC